ncbi:MAG: response regulator [Bdellovibrionales bacterium]|nr:response regulator [Bdellovibrionales bacterium]
MNLYSHQSSKGDLNLAGSGILQAKVLIVDDDIDSALLVSSIFNNLGCYTDYALNYIEAKSKINDNDLDIIILDWCLDSDIEADQLLYNCLKFQKRFASGLEETKHPLVVTYSSLPASNIHWIHNPRFEYKGHWDKSLTHEELVQNGLDLLDYAGL